MDKAPGGPKVPRKMKVPGYLKMGSHHKKHAVKRKKRPVVFKFREFRVTQPVNMKNYVMEYTIPPTQIMEFRKGKIKYANNPKLEVRDSKASTLKDEFSGWCGRKQGIRNWLYFV